MASTIGILLDVCFLFALIFPIHKKMSERQGNAFAPFYQTRRRKNMTNTKKQTTYMVELALMVAIILLMSFTPLGYLKTPVLDVTLLTIPVAVGAVLLGPAGGAICGLAFGLTSFYQALTASSVFSATLLGISPVGTFITTIVPRVLEGLLTGLIFAGLHNLPKTKKISYYVASLACPVLNTILFMSSLVIFFYNSDFIQGLATNAGVTNPFSFVIVFVGTQGVIEAVICFLVASVVSRTLYPVVKKMN